MPPATSVVDVVPRRQFRRRSGFGLRTDTTSHLHDAVPLHGLQNDPLSSRDM
jgi:hypothetical protein